MMQTAHTQKQAVPQVEAKRPAHHAEAKAPANAGLPLYLQARASKSLHGTRAAPPGDRLEHEADAMAARLLTMGAPTPESSIAGQGSLGSQPGGGGAWIPLPAAERAYFQPRLGYDLSAVRVHTGAAAETRAGDLHAKAFTHGPDIYFGRGHWAPGTPRGRRLLAHELVHVVQQAHGESHLLQRELEDVPRSLSQSVHPGALSRAELDAEIQSLRRWLERNPNRTPERLHLEGELARLERYLTSRPAQRQSTGSVRATGRSYRSWPSPDPVVESGRSRGGPQPGPDPRSGQADRARDNASSVPETPAQRARTYSVTETEVAPGVVRRSTTASAREADLARSTRQVSPQEVLNLARQIGFTNMPEFLARHAEVQQAVANPNQPIGVSRPMCDSCFRFFVYLARARGAQVVSDPFATRTFLPGNQVVEIWRDGAQVRMTLDPTGRRILSTSVTPAGHPGSGGGQTPPPASGGGAAPATTAAQATTGVDAQAIRAQRAMSIWQRELPQARSTGRFSPAAIDALWELNPQQAERLVRQSGLPNNAQSSTLSRLPGQPLPARTRAGVGAMAALVVLTETLPLIQASQARSYGENVKRALTDVMWWQAKGVFPALQAVNDRWWPQSNEWTTDPARIQQLINSRDIDYLGLTSIDDRYWDGFQVWATTHLNNYRDWYTYIMVAEEAGTLRQSDDRWEYRAANVSGRWYGHSVDDRWVYSERLSTILNAANQYVRDTTRAELQNVGQRGGVQVETSISQAGSYRHRTALESLPQPIGHKRFKPGASRRLYTLRNRQRASGYSENAEFYVFPATASYEHDIPQGYLLVGGANLVAYLQILVTRNAVNIGNNDYRLARGTELMLARESDLEDVR